MQILVAYDGSEYSQNALEKVLPLAKGTGSTLWLLMVLEPLGVMVKPGVHAGFEGTGEHEQKLSVVSELETEIEDRARASLSRAEMQCEQAGIEFHSLLRFGSVRDTILETVEEKNADILVIGTREMNRFKRFFVDAVTDYLVHHAPCSVMVVRSSGSEE